MGGAQIKDADVQKLLEENPIDLSHRMVLPSVNQFPNQSDNTPVTIPVEENKIEKIIKVFLFTFAAIFAGYAVSDYKKPTLNLFNHVIMRFVIIFIIVSSFYNISSINWKQNIVTVLGITIVSTASIELYGNIYK